MIINLYTEYIINWKFTNTLSILLDIFLLISLWRLTLARHLCTYIDHLESIYT